MRIPVLFTVLAALIFSGCFYIRKPKPIAGEVEESFKTRWVAKRMGELQANGTATDPRDARKIAVEEFTKKYEFTSIAHKPDPVAGSTP
jgi:hypothetical protein